MALLKKDSKIANLLRTNRNLSKKLSRMDAVFNALQESVIVLRKDSSIAFANESSKKLLAMPDNYENYPLINILPDLKNDIDDVCKSGNVKHKEFQISYPEKKYLKAYFVPEKSQTDSDCVLILNDATKEKISEQETIENEKINSVINLASGIAHEIGNPLNSMSIHLQLTKRLISKIEDASLREKLESSVSICKSEIDRLDDIIKNFLKAIRPKKALLVECDALKPLGETLATVASRLQDSQIDLEIFGETNTPSILGDETLLKQLYFNILKNAIEAIGAKGKISIATFADDNFLNISFTDTGCGIDAKNLTRIFEPYYTNKSNGNGLGMLIVERIIKAHNGKISIDSKVSVGTKITISLCRARPEIKRLV